MTLYVNNKTVNNKTVNNKTVIYFDSFRIEYIPQKITVFINNTNVFYFCIGFIDFMFNGNSLTNFTNFFYQMISNKKGFNFKLFSD